MKVLVEGGILAGGLSTRMDGQEKGLQHYQDRPMIEWVSAAIKPFVTSISINCNRHHDEFNRFADATYSDCIEGFFGPLAGIHSLLAHSKTNYVLISPCDTPLIGKAYAQTMLAQLASKPSSPIVCARTGDKIHPLHILISTDLKNSIETTIRSKQLKVMEWLRRQNITWADFGSDYESKLRNFNSKSDLTDN